MPKKHHNNHLPSKPKSTVPASFGTSLSTTSKNGGQVSPSTSATTVNELIGHLRIAQTDHVKSDGRHSHTLSQRSLPPHLRSLLDVPEPPPPKPRAGVQPNAQGRMRRMAGPPAPQSWLESSIHAPERIRARNVEIDSEGLHYDPETKLDVLPGAEFPLPLSLQDVVLKKMAKNWQWHLQNDGIYLSEIPTLLKEMLLSYITKYAPVTDQDARLGLRVLFPRAQDFEEYAEEAQDEYDEVTRLDLTSLMHSWTSHNALKRELLYTRKAAEFPAFSSPDHGATTASEAPESWENASPKDDSDSGASDRSEPLVTVPPKMDMPLSLRFPNLVHLSLSRVGGTASLVSWPDLLAIAPYLSTLTSLSLANWPIPTHTTVSVSTSSPRSLFTRNKVPPSYTGGPKHHANFEANWAEAGSILRRLSKELYCLRWLDFSGCTSWTPAMTPQKATQVIDDLLGFDASSPELQGGESGPGWNQSWRSVTHIRFAVNWVPKALTPEGLLAIDDWLKDEILRGKTLDKSDPEINGQASILRDPISNLVPTGHLREPDGMEPRRYMDSRLGLHASPETASTMRGKTIQDWDVEQEREKYHQKKELEQFIRDQRTIRHTADLIRRLRLKAKGKFIEFDFGHDHA